MLTSYQTLLGGITAVLCATGMVSQSDSNGPQSVRTESSAIQPVEIAYRGSGRLDDQPESSNRAQSRSSLLSHRGSGRIQPQCLIASPPSSPI